MAGSLSAEPWRCIPMSKCHLVISDNAGELQTVRGLDIQLSVSPHSTNVTQSCRFLLYNVRWIWVFLSTEASLVLLQSLAISRLKLGPGTSSYCMPPDLAVHHCFHQVFSHASRCSCVFFTGFSSSQTLPEKRGEKRMSGCLYDSPWLRHVPCYTVTQQRLKSQTDISDAKLTNYHWEKWTLHKHKAFQEKDCWCLNNRRNVSSATFKNPARGI